LALICWGEDSDHTHDLTIVKAKAAGFSRILSLLFLPGDAGDAGDARFLIILMTDHRSEPLNHLSTQDRYAEEHGFKRHPFFRSLNTPFQNSAQYTHRTQ
jgi:hypothetical protein